MTIKKNILFISALLLLNLCITSCGSDDDSIHEEHASSVDFEKAQLFDFYLSEVDEDLIEGISIKQPTMIDGIPQNKGEIKIELAYTVISKFSLKQVDFNTSDFSISPAIGKQSILPGKRITYTITSSKETEVSLEYDVLVIIKELHSGQEKLAINSFSFLNTHNPDLTENVSSTEIREHSSGNQYDATILMIVPQGTNFSNLVPTIDFEGNSITYKTNVGDSENFIEFTPGTFLDFKYPNQIAVRVHNSDQSEFKEYRVLVDVKNPIVFEETSAILNNGDVVFEFHAFNNVIGFTNYGNYPITSDLFVSEMNVTKTPEATIQNYFINVILKGDDIINTGEKGRLYAQVNFPNLNGTFTGRTDYKIDAIFNIVNKNRSIKKGTDVLNEEFEFNIYDPLKIELQANVFVSTP